MRLGSAAIVSVLLGPALVLPACGGKGTAATGGERAATSRAEAGASGTKAKARPVARQCGRRYLGGFLDSIESLNNTLAVGLSYDDYLVAVNNVRATYAAVQVDHLPIVCLARVAGPAEQALNVYIDAANTWGDCLASASCNPEAVEPKLQHKWAEASNLLADAQSGRAP